MSHSRRIVEESSELEDDQDYGHNQDHRVDMWNKHNRDEDVSVDAWNKHIKQQAIPNRQTL